MHYKNYKLEKKYMYGELKVITLSTGTKINLEELNCLMKTTSAEIEELLIILKTKRAERELRIPSIKPPLTVQVNNEVKSFQ